MMHDEIQRLRRLVALAEDALARRGDRPPGDDRLIGVVTAVTALPTSAGVFYGLHPARISGPAAEGGAATIAVDTSRTFYAGVVGRAPSLGDKLVARRVPERWVARRGGGGTPPMPNCQLVVTSRVCSSAGAILTGASVTVTRSAIMTATLTAGGSGFTNGTDYSASLTGGGGAGASVKFDVAGGSVTNLRVVEGGTGWVTAPTLGFGAAGAGSGASGTVTIGTVTLDTILTGGTVTGFSVTNAASNGPYSNVAPAVTIAASPLGTAYTATGRANLTGGALGTPTVTAPGSYATVPTVSFGGSGGGTTAVGAARMGLNSATPSAAGTGYAVGNVLTLSGGTAATTAQVTVATVNGSGGILTVTVSRVGNYLSLPTSPVSVTGGAGTGATFTPDWGVVAVNMTGAGTLYYNPTVVFSSGSAAATVTATAIRVASIALLFGGDGYASAPAVTIDAPPSGTTATATASLATAAASFPLPLCSSPSKYTVAVTPPASPAGLASNTAAVTVTATGTTTATVVLGPATGYTCTADCCTNSPIPRPSAVNTDPFSISDGGGTISASYQGLTAPTGGPRWTGSGTRTVSGHSVTVQFDLYCTVIGGTAWLFTVTNTGTAFGYQFSISNMTCYPYAGSGSNFNFCAGTHDADLCTLYGSTNSFTMSQ